MLKITLWIICAIAALLYGFVWCICRAGARAEDRARAMRARNNIVEPPWE